MLGCGIQYPAMHVATEEQAVAYVAVEKCCSKSVLKVP